MPVTINGTTGITTPALVNGTALSFRNKIINGNFDFWQRGTSLTSGTGDRYLADRFLSGSVGSTYTVSRELFANGQTDVPNNPNYFHRTVVSSVAGNGNTCLLRQRIESVKTLAGQTATLSFYAKADANKPISIEFVQVFNSSPSVDEIGVQKINLTSTWQKFTINVNIPSITGTTIAANDHLAVRFWFSAGSDFNGNTNSLGQQSGTFDIAQVQLEEGSVATPFENRPIGTELALCQRYYQTSGTTDAANLLRFHGNVTSGSSYAANAWLKVQMRANPTVTLQNQGTANGFPATVGTSGSGVLAIVETRTANATASGVFSSYWTASAEL